MSKKVLRYFKPKKVTPEMMAKMEQGFQLLNEALGDDTNITKEEYKSLPIIADKRKQECDDVFSIAQKNSEFVLAPVSLEDMKDQKTYYEFCDTIRVNEEAFKIRLAREQNISGGKYYNNCNVFEGDVDDKVNRGNNPKAQNVKVQLDSINRKRGGGPKSGNKDNNKAGDKSPK